MPDLVHEARAWLIVLTNTNHYPDPSYRTVWMPPACHGASLSLRCCGWLFTIRVLLHYHKAICNRVTLFVCLYRRALLPLLVEASREQIVNRRNMKLIRPFYVIASSSSASARLHSSATAAPSTYKHCSSTVASQFPTSKSKPWCISVSTLLESQHPASASITISSTDWIHRSPSSRILHTWSLRRARNRALFICR